MVSLELADHLPYPADEAPQRYDAALLNAVRPFLAARGTAR
jgi:hypothetical protein